MKKRLISAVSAVMITGLLSTSVLASKANIVRGEVEAHPTAEAEYKYTEANTVPSVIAMGADDITSEKEEIKEEVEEEVVEETKEEEPPVQEVSTIDTSKYSSVESSGFVVTTGNQTYSLSSSDMELLMAITAAESDQSYDDALAVISVILNRCEDGAWARSHGTNPVSQATAPNQFVVYQEGHYKKYLGNVPSNVRSAVNDALNGVRNNHYLSFRSNHVTSYSNNMVTPTGNRYK